MVTTTTVNVEGMTCGHCVAAVTEELVAIEGVTAVDVDLGSGRAVIDHDGPLDPSTVAAAVDEAGYRLGT